MPPISEISKNIEVVVFYTILLRSEFQIKSVILNIMWQVSHDRHSPVSSSSSEACLVCVKTNIKQISVHTPYNHDFLLIISGSLRVIE